jgi:hypothetical protein
MSSIIKSSKERYEKVSISSLLSKLNLPAIQRVLNEERVDFLYSQFYDIFKMGREIISPGVLIIAENKDGSYFLLDGQHRFYAYKKLYDVHKHDQTLVVNIIKQDETGMRQLFNLINDTVPVKEIPLELDLSESRTVMKHFTDKYKPFFKLTPHSVHRPHVNSSTFNEVVNKLLLVFKKADKVIEEIEKINTELSDCNYTQFLVKKSYSKADTESALLKARMKGNFFIGMFPELECLNKLYGKRSVQVRKVISYPLKIKIWMKHAGASETTKCPFCFSDITLKTCHIAHDISHANGGEETLDNLFPCCVKCNLSLGSKNVSEEFNEA